MNRRNITIAVIAVLALGIALVVYGILTTPRKSSASPKNVVVAAMNIPAGAHLQPAMVTTIQKPSDQVEANALVDPASAVGMIATADIAQGTQITPTRVARPAPAPEGLQVAVGQRAITIGVDPVKGLSGLLHPGDHVDVLAAPPRGNFNPTAYAIVRDARVLAVGAAIAPTPAPALSGSPAPANAPTPQPATTITLGVSARDANIILAADLNSTLRLALRSPHEPTRQVIAETIVYPTPVPPAPPQTAASPWPGIPVVNGDVVTAVKP